ncbi:septum formation protein Maf [candidate division KSB1 bacterium]|nr:septum formation protein Maf [candidate division KSB1 bacterium]
MAFFGTVARRIILASASPRRHQLFRLLFDNFEIIESQVNENLSLGMAPLQLAQHLALLKAQDVSEQIDDGIIVGADSIVVVENKILGKPIDAADARKMLGLLSGKVHEVYTGIAIVGKPSNATKITGAVTHVTFRNIENWEIDRYIEIGNPFDKAGAYGIQNEAAVFIEKISGCYYNVMGFPVNEVYQAIKPFMMDNRAFGDGYRSAFSV